MENCDSGVLCKCSVLAREAWKRAKNCNYYDTCYLEKENSRWKRFLSKATTAAAAAAACQTEPNFSLLRHPTKIFPPASAAANNRGKGKGKEIKCASTAIREPGVNWERVPSKYKQPLHFKVAQSETGIKCSQFHDAQTHSFIFQFNFSLSAWMKPTLNCC